MLCLRLQRLDGGAGRLADHVELALQRVLHDDVGAAADEDLAMIRLLLAHGRRHRHVRVDRHVAPAEQHLALGLDRALELLLAGQAGRVLLGQEDHADAVLAGGRQLDALLGHLFAVQRVGQLDQDAGAVAHQLVGADGAAVVQVLQDLQRLADDVVALLALDVGDEADAAGVVLVGGRIQAVFLQMGDLGSRRHGAHSGNSGGNPRIVQRTTDAKQNNWGQIPIISRSISTGFNWGQVRALWCASDAAHLGRATRAFGAPLEVGDVVRLAERPPPECRFRECLLLALADPGTHQGGIGLVRANGVLPSSQ